MGEEAIEADFNCFKTENVLQKCRNLQLGCCRSDRHLEFLLRFTAARTFFRDLKWEINSWLQAQILRLALKVMLIKSSTKDSLFQQALRRPKKVRRFLSHLEILKILGMGSLFPKKNLAYKSIIQRIHNKESCQSKVWYQTFALAVGSVLQAVCKCYSSHKVITPTS